MDPLSLTLDELLALHADQVERYGGTLGIRDRGLISSSLAVPMATFAGEFLHMTISEMAAAYLFHIAQSQPFVDGNKRVALAGALAFLWLNDIEIKAEEGQITELVLGIAEGRLTKSEAAVFLQNHSQKRT